MKTVEKLRDYYLNPEQVELTDKEKEYDRKLWRAYAMLEQYDSPTVAAQMLMEGEKHLSGSSISSVTAYKYIRECQVLIAPIVEIKTDFLKSLAVQNIRQDIKAAQKMIRWAEENENQKVWNIAMQRKDAAINTLVKVTGMDRKEDEQIDFASLEGHVYVISVDQKFQDIAVKALESSGSVDLSEFFKTAIEEIEYEDVIENESTT
jgi:predicted HNH restriction endonuclease